MSSYADSGQDCWQSQVRKLRKNKFKKHVQSVFDRFWIVEINAEKIVNGANANKLRYVKSSFSKEPKHSRFKKSTFINNKVEVLCPYSWN